MSQQHRWWLIPNEHLGHRCPSLTITSIRSASLTCPSAVCPLTHSSPCVAPEQSRACDSRLACRQSTHSQIVNPMIQAQELECSQPLSAPCFILSALLMGNRCRGTGGHASFTQTNSPPQACAMRQPVACGPAETCQTSWGASPLKSPPTPLTHTRRGVWRTFSTYACSLAQSVCVCVKIRESTARLERERERERKLALSSLRASQMKNWWFGCL